MQNSLYFLITLFSFLTSYSFAQVKVYSRLELKPGETLYAGPDSIMVIDTLVMGDGSTIKFSPASNTKLGVRIAYIGSNCTITSKGEDGKNGKLNLAGENGVNGGNMDIDIHFMKLGSLVINTQGGNGGNGYVGKHGSRRSTQTTSYPVTAGDGTLRTVAHTVQMSDGSSGQAGTPGGKGGNGGNLNLIFSSDNFIVNLNSSPKSTSGKVHVLRILYEAGKNGKAGRDGDSYTGSTEMSNNYKKGMPVSVHTEPGQDGKIKITNANKQ